MRLNDPTLFTTPMLFNTALNALMAYEALKTQVRASTQRLNAGDATAVVPSPLEVEKAMTCAVNALTTLMDVVVARIQAKFEEQQLNLKSEPYRTSWEFLHDSFTLRGFVKHLDAVTAMFEKGTGECVEE